jgi:very-short-patch-repair endonuclease
VLTHSEYVKNGWIKTKSQTDKFYSFDDCVKILKEDDYYLRFKGKAKNRTMLKENPQLYNTIYKYTFELNLLHKQYSSFYIRILYIVIHNCNIDNIKCKKCGNFSSWNNVDGKFTDLCKKCFRTGKLQFKFKYGDDWEKHYNTRMDIVKKNKTNSLTWYQNKYGYDEGLKLYLERCEKLNLHLITLKSKKYSKISQELFWSIYNGLSDFEKNDKIYFKELNDEYFIKIPNNLFNIEYHKSIFFVDFLYGNKIIEYNGIYWHNNMDYEIYRIETLKKMGYDVLVIDSNDFNRNKKPNEIIIKCLNFIRDGK